MKTKIPKIRREPIQFSPHAVGVLHVFKKIDHLEDIWMTEIEPYLEETRDIYEKSAKQFISQLEDLHCMAFLKALRNEADKKIKEWEKEVNDLKK